MAIPSLAAMAALTLFHNPHMQPEDVSVSYGLQDGTNPGWDYSAPARVIQRRQRRRNLLNRAATTINKLIRAFRVRAFVAGLSRARFVDGQYVNDTGASDFLMYGFRPGFMDSVWAEVGSYGRYGLISRQAIRSGRRYMAQRKDEGYYNMNARRNIA